MATKLDRNLKLRDSIKDELARIYVAAYTRQDLAQGDLQDRKWAELRRGSKLPVYMQHYLQGYSQALLETAMQHTIFTYVGADGWLYVPGYDYPKVAHLPGSVYRKTDDYPGGLEELSRNTPPTALVWQRTREIYFATEYDKTRMRAGVHV